MASFLSNRLREQYPDEMTVVLQHRFWDLIVDDERFEVKLTFNSIPERLVIPYQSIKVFFDPSVPYGLQFEASQMMSEADRQTGQVATLVGRDLGQGSGREPGQVAEFRVMHLMGTRPGCRQVWRYRARPRSPKRPVILIR